ncbi:hypothetical protein [Amycolatopsis vancoresmycina]|uniref:Uncharacterized protein n=1 Tax=Amycolatopsis vancoresmycina DSM 44592 TaxID=1292037 RepID=R1HWZ9_9PSEU|nr:hypothetical protein [Amycolatopsis vancoresmycina]EOD62824.1 hypothetical protein H480_39825 [Amycolatopsis vancoresmycina DSM 44592]
MTDHELATKLKELAETAAPPPRIDLDRARRIGGRRRRVRTTALVLGCAAVVAAGGVTAVSVFRPVPPLAAAPVAGAPTAAPPAPTDNPIVAKAAFGWLPEQIAGVEYAVGAHGDTALAIGRGEPAPMIWLSVYDQDPPVPRDLGGQPSRIPVRIGGHDGYWLTTDPGDPVNHGSAYLQWRAADGRWARLNAHYLLAPDLQEVLTRVAEGVTLGNRAVPLPLRITSLPGTFHLSDGYLMRRPDQDGVPWRLVLQYSVNGGLATINVSPPGGPTDGLGVPECEARKGLRVCVAFDQPKVVGITAKELLGRITLIGTDETKWTTHVTG